MNNGLITDTVLNAAEQAVADVGGVVFINLMFGLFLPLSFLIPSSSGLATVAMPIMAPLAGFAGVPEFLVVTAYQTGNGLINLITPTSAVVMGGLAIARIGYGTWLRFVWPMLLDPARHPVDARPDRRRTASVAPARSSSRTAAMLIDRGVRGAAIDRGHVPVVALADVDRDHAVVHLLDAGQDVEPCRRTGRTDQPELTRGPRPGAPPCGRRGTPAARPHRPGRHAPPWPPGTPDRRRSRSRPDRSTGLGQ